MGLRQKRIRSQIRVGMDYGMGGSVSGVFPRDELAGKPASEVIERVLETHQPGVVVMGTLARAGLKGVFMGNTAERVLGTVGGSVLAVKPQGFETPIAI